MPSRVEYLAREIAQNAGYDPDQLVVEVDRDRDFDFLAIGVAPVEISSIKPIYMRFEKEAYEILSKELCDG